MSEPFERELEEIDAHRFEPDSDHVRALLIDAVGMTSEEIEGILQSHELSGWESVEWLLRSEAFRVDEVGDAIMRFPTCWDWDAYLEIVRPRMWILDADDRDAVISIRC